MNRRVMLLTGIASVGLASCGPSRSGNYQISEPQPGQGLIVMYRPYAAVGGGLRFPMTLNGSSIGGLANGTVMSQSVPAGQHTVQTSAPSIDGTSSVTINIAAGETVFVRGRAVLGYPTYRPQLLIVSPAEARSQIASM